MNKPIEFFFDVGSPAAYLAQMQMPRVMAETRSTIIYRPMLLGAVFKATGNAAPIGVKAQYNRHDLERCARRLEIPLVINPHFPVNTLLMMRVATAAQEEGLLDACLAAVYRGMWVEGLNMGEREVLLGALKSGGLNGPHLLARAEEPEVKQRLKDTTDEAVARGVFGAPTFFVGDEMFWGQDRIDQVIEAAKS
ncbi:MAG: 2-hydroxychromene-2-carboxylate isomerase [Reyranellaceae bacterium]